MSMTLHLTLLNFIRFPNLEPVQVSVNDSTAFCWTNQSSTEVRKVWKLNIIRNEHHEALMTYVIRRHCKSHWCDMAMECQCVTIESQGPQGPQWFLWGAWVMHASSVMQTWLFYICRTCDKYTVCSLLVIEIWDFIRLVGSERLVVPNTGFFYYYLNGESRGSLALGYIFPLMCGQIVMYICFNV